MPRGATVRIQRVESDLRLRLASGLFIPGESFLSARQVALQFGVSYQTAHRILSKFEAEGLLLRSAGAPTRIPGDFPKYRSVALLFDPRARREGSFGNRLLALLTVALSDAGIAFEVIFKAEVAALAPEVYPVFWETQICREAMMSLQRHCLFLNQKPILGLASRLADSITVDDFAGGLAAAELLLRLYGCQRPAMIAGHRADSRSQKRAEGFRACYPHAKILHAGSWSPRASDNVFRQVSALSPDGVFCANDRIASVLKHHSSTHFSKQPAIIGFDDAPIAKECRITTIAIPWESFISAAVDIILRRLDGSRELGQHRMLCCREVIRS